MLRARCIAEGVRAVYPAAIGGMMVAEEAQDTTAARDAPVESKHMGPAEVVPPAPPAHYPEDAFEKNVDAWAKTISSGKMTEERLVAMVSAKGAITEEQRAELRERVMELMPAAEPTTLDAETGEVVEEGATL